MSTAKASAVSTMPKRAWFGANDRPYPGSDGATTVRQAGRRRIGDGEGERRRVARPHRLRPPSIAVPPLFPAAGIVYHGRHVIRRNRMSPAPRFVGSEVKRLEDPRLIRGQAQYTDDLVLRGLAHAQVVRSSHAHARLTRLDVARAAAHPGVLAVFTARDLQGEVK